MLSLKAGLCSVYKFFCSFAFVPREAFCLKHDAFFLQVVFAGNEQANDMRCLKCPPCSGQVESAKSIMFNETQFSWGHANGALLCGWID